MLNVSGSGSVDHHTVQLSADCKWSSSSRRPHVWTSTRVSESSLFSSFLLSLVQLGRSHSPSSGDMWFPKCCSSTADDAGDVKPQLARTLLDEAHSGMVLAFEHCDGSLRQVTCTQRPLGVKFTKAAPLTVTEVYAHGHAHDLGIQTGWALRSIDEEDLIGRSSECVIQLLSASIKCLPSGGCRTVRPS